MPRMPEYRRTEAKELRSGDIVFHGNEDCVVIANDRTTRKNQDGYSRKIVLQRLSDSKRQECVKNAQAEMMRMLRQTMAWRPVPGDVVLYRFPEMTAWEASIRHGAFWVGTGAPRHQVMDLKVISDVSFGPAVLVHQAAQKVMTDPDMPFRCGAVMVGRTPHEPSVLVRIEPDLWRSSCGVEESDAMVRLGLRKRELGLVHFGRRAVPDGY